MDIFDIHNVKMEKANAMILYLSFRNIAKLFRLVELFLAVVFFSWISSRLPFVITVFGVYFRQLLSVVVSPLFIFLIGNVIILFLVVKSGQITGNPVAVDNVRSDSYEEIVNNEPVTEPEEIVYHDKRIISEVNTNTNSNSKPITRNCYEENKINLTQATIPTKKLSANSSPDLDLKIYRRSQSENLMKNNCDFLQSDEVQSKLKRSETEIGRRKVVETPAEKTVVEKLSNEEFQKRIERFIARQVRFHHEEKFAIVPHSHVQ